MANQLRAEQKNVGDVFAKGKYLIPEYQRPYSWERDECRTLWENLCEFAFPNDNPKSFDREKDVYFMGTILTFRNPSDEFEVIDGQQRLVTFLLMLRAFYRALENAQDDVSKNIRRKIEECIWKLDDDDRPDKTDIKLKYKVIADEEAAELKKILATGAATPRNKSNYATNYRLFQKWITDLNNDKPGYLSYLVRRILNNVVLLPIEADNQNTALRIFTTLNDRGRPLSDSDIFKAQFYKFYLKQSSVAKDKFVQRWKDLAELCDKNFHPRKGTPVDDLFMRYMYYLFAKAEIRNDTFPDMRDYYERNNYAALRSGQTFDELELLANFWDDVATRSEKFSPRVLRKLFVLNYAPYNIWTYVVSIYFLGNRELDEEKFFRFLDKITAMLLMHAIVNPGTQNIRRPFFKEFNNILHGRPIEFKDFKQSEKFIRERLSQTRFSNQRAITGSMSAWWTFSDEKQELPPLGTKLHLEHIYAKKRHENHPNELSNPELLETLGNKSLLEERINIGASDYRFADKKIFYLGDGKSKPGTFNRELQFLAENLDDFNEDEIVERNEEIFNAFIAYLGENNLLA